MKFDRVIWMVKYKISVCVKIYQQACARAAGCSGFMGSGIHSLYFCPSNIQYLSILRE